MSHGVCYLSSIGSLFLNTLLIQLKTFTHLSAMQGYISILFGNNSKDKEIVLNSEL